jgi:hypothetical protein
MKAALIAVSFLLLSMSAFAKNAALNDEELAALGAGPSFEVAPGLDRLGTPCGGNGCDSRPDKPPGVEHQSPRAPIGCSPWDPRGCF